jgi:hypothetical protein
LQGANEDIMTDRRTVLLGLSAATCLGLRRARAAGPAILVSKDPNCGCCNGWVEHLQKAAFSVEARDTTDLDRIKSRLGVPADLAACHTAELSGYVIEGHVPAGALRKLLAERPAAKGLAVPGMPAGSPGMEIPGAPLDEYDVILFGATRRVFARYRGGTELSR